MKLEYDEPLSNFALKFYLRRYTESAPANMAGDRTELGSGGGKRGQSEGVSLLRSMGVRELYYRMVFIAHSVVNTADPSAAGAGGAGGRGLHSSTLRLNISAFCGIGGTCRGS